MQPAEVKERVKAFVAENFLFRDDRSDISETESLIDSGIMDSTGVLELVAFLEDELGIKVEDADIMPDNLKSIATISAFASRKLGSAAVA